MADRQPTVWDLDPHTKAKHSILRRYLEAWLPKMASRWSRLVFVDGFAGPGEYAGGEDGSPLIAIKAALQHKRDFADRQLVYVFVEKDRRRCDNLRALITSMQLPEFMSVEIRHGEFSTSMPVVMSAIERLGREPDPALVMLDPFGVSDVDLEFVRQIARQPKSELLISFMYESISRHLGHPSFEKWLDRLFGTPVWRQAQSLVSSEKREFLHDLYRDQLRSAGMSHVRSFELRDSGNRTEYYLFFATHSIEGLKAIKAAMWNVDSSGGVQFSDTTNFDQLTLFGRKPDYDALERLILNEFRPKGAVPVEEIEKFVIVDTPFRETHFKQPILRRLEKTVEIVVHRPAGRRASYWGVGTTVDFSRP